MPDLMSRQLLQDNSIDHLFPLLHDSSNTVAASTLCVISSRANKQLAEHILGNEPVMEHFISNLKMTYIFTSFFNNT